MTSIQVNRAEELLEQLSASTEQLNPEKVPDPKSPKPAVLRCFGSLDFMRTEELFT
jgi:hypothetical protein